MPLLLLAAAAELRHVLQGRCDPGGKLLARAHRRREHGQRIVCGILSWWWLAVVGAVK
jgi:hypothetical protein